MNLTRLLYVVTGARDPKRRRKKRFTKRPDLMRKPAKGRSER